MNLVVITPTPAGHRITVNDELVAILQDETAAVNFANALQSGLTPSVTPEGRWSTPKDENQGHGRPLISKGEA